MGFKSLWYFYALHIVSNFVTTMLLIYQDTKIRIYEVMRFVPIQIGSILILNISLQSIIHLQASSCVFNHPSISNSCFHKLFSN